MRAALLAIGLLGVSACAVAQDGEIDFRAHYCLQRHRPQVVAPAAATIPLPGAGAYLAEAVRNHQAQQAARLQRLEAYVAARSGAVDAATVAAAASLAEADVRDAKSDQDMCTVQCGSARPVLPPRSQRSMDDLKAALQTHMSTILACAKDCAGRGEAAARLRVCEQVDWLPP